MAPSSSSVQKSDLVGRLEPYIFNRLSRGTYEIQESEPGQLLSGNRLDILARVNFLQMEEVDPGFGEDVYFETIRAQSDGTFKDPHDASRQSFQDYLTAFRNLSASIEDGFKSSGPFVPLAKDGSILNGAHRVAIALFRNLKVPTVQTELAPVNSGWDYLHSRGVADAHLQHFLYLFSKHAPEVYLAIFWPIAERLGIGPHMLKNQIGTVQLRGNLQMVKNIAFEAYKDMDWIGSPSNSYKGLDSKTALSAGGLMEEQSVLVSIFQEKKGLDEVKRVKADLRSHDGGSTRAVHITDNSEETRRITGLAFRASGQSFLKLANPFRFDTRIDLVALKRRAREMGIKTDNFAVDGSTVLGLYGLRQPRDLDLMALDVKAQSSLGAEIRSDQLQHHEEPLKRLIQSPRFHFELENVRIISIEQIARMKGNRREPKDLDDLGLVREIVAENRASFRPSMAARVRLFRVRSLKAIRSVIRHILRPIGLEEKARKWYDRMLS